MELAEETGCTPSLPWVIIWCTDIFWCLWGVGLQNRPMAIWLLHHSLSQHQQLCSMVFYRIKSSKFIKYHPFYYFFSFIYVGEVVTTSKVAMAVRRHNGLPQGWLAVVVERLGMTMARDVGI